jgi:predicted ATPase
LGAWDELHNGSQSFVDEVSSWLGDRERLDSGYWLQQKVYREVDVDSELFRLLNKGNLTDEDADRITEPLSRLVESVRLSIVPAGQLNPDSQVVLRPSDVGIGISQVVPVIVSALGGPHRLVVIEQPELHLHPRIQARLGDLFISAIANPIGNHIILETHSEHLILRLLRRIRETADGELAEGVGALYPEDMSVVYISGGEGVAVAQQLRIDSTGEFVDRWPNGFFDERAQELF